MKKESVEFLNTYLDIYVHDGLDGVFELYKDFSSYEAPSFEGLRDSVSEFCEFLRRNIARIKRKGEYTEGAVLKTIESFKRSILVSIERYSNDSYKNFASLAYELSPNKRNEKILDVGSGRIPSSSIWLARKIDNVLSIDTEFYLSDVSLRNLGVLSREAYFGYSSSIEGYSFVIGRCPCSAIKYMVQKCAKANVPYLIKLCNCDIAAARKYNKSLVTWGTILPEYDSNVKLFRDFAYNLDISEEQFSKLIDKYDSNPPQRASRQLKTICSCDRSRFLLEEDEIQK